LPALSFTKALNYVNSDKNQYKYRLEGFDKDWNFVDKERKATYTNLDPGTYRFIVKGSNNDGYWNEDGKSIILIITPPFWETLWFRILILVFIITALYFAYRTRVRYYENQKIVLTKKVNKRTIELYEANSRLEEINEEVTQQKEEITIQREEKNLNLSRAQNLLQVFLQVDL